MDALDAEVADIVSAVPPDRRLLVTNHDALGYFADRYGFEIVGTVLPVHETLGRSIPGRARELGRRDRGRGRAGDLRRIAGLDRRRRRRSPTDLGVDVVSCTPTRSATTDPGGDVPRADALRRHRHRRRPRGMSDDFLTDPVVVVGRRRSRTTSSCGTTLWAVLLTALCTSLVGTWVVLRGMSFLGDALAHGVLPGIAIAFVLGGNTTLGRVPRRAGDGRRRQRRARRLAAARRRLDRRSSSSASSPSPSSSCPATQASYTGDLNRFLFGSITGVDTADLTASSSRPPITLAAVVVLLPRLPRRHLRRAPGAAVLGLHPRLAHVGLLVLLSVAIVASFATVGTSSCSPSSSPRRPRRRCSSRGCRRVMVVATVIGAVSGVVGLLISYHHATAAGATMALCTVAVFFVALVAPRRFSCAGTRRTSST